MSNYMSEYEEYYKNINKKNNDNKSRYIPLNSQKREGGYLIGRNDEQVKYFLKDYWIKKIIIQFLCSFGILIIFVSFKYIKNDYIKRVYIWSKGAISSDFQYDEAVEALNNCELGTFKIKELNIGGFTIEDLKSDRINYKINNFLEYLRNSMNTQKI